MVGALPDRVAARFVDLREGRIDPEAQAALARLKGRLRDLLGDAYVAEHRALVTMATKPRGGSARSAPSAWTGC
jgi:hypothetical protein